MAHLLLSEQSEMIQNQARLEAMVETSKNPVQMVTLAEIRPRDVILEIYISLKDFWDKVGQSQQERIQVAYSTLQTSIDISCLLTEYHDTVSNSLKLASLSNQFPHTSTAV